MATILFANNANSTLAGPLTATAATLNVAAGTGVLFPQPGTGQYFCLTLVDAASGLLNEILHVTAVNGDTFTIQRGQENSAPQSWLAGDLAANLITAGSLQAFAQTAAITGGAIQGTDTGTNGNQVVATSTTPAVSAPSAGQYYQIVKGPQGNSGATTLTVGSGGNAVTVVYKDGTGLEPGAWPASASAILYYTGGVFQFLSCQSAPAVRSYFGTDTGSADALAVAPTPPVPALTDNVEVLFVKSGSANATANPTLKVGSLAAAPIVRRDGSALKAGDLPASSLTAAKYDSGLGAFRLVGTAASQIASTPNPTNTQISTNSIAGLSLNAGSQAIQDNQPTTVQWNTNVIPSTIGTYANGNLRVLKPGWYEVILNLVITANTTHATDSLSVLTQVVVTPANGGAPGGNNDDRGKAFQPPGTNNGGSVALVPGINTGPLYFGMNDSMSVQITAHGLYFDATNITLQQTTNLKFVYLNP